jgi:hypothetical protein
MLHPVKVLSVENDVVRSHFVPEDLNDCGIKLAAIEHGAQHQAHANLGADRNVWVKPLETTKDAGEIGACGVFG